MIRNALMTVTAAALLGGTSSATVIEIVAANSPSLEITDLADGPAGPGLNPMVDGQGNSNTSTSVLGQTFVGQRGFSGQTPSITRIVSLYDLPDLPVGFTLSEATLTYTITRDNTSVADVDSVVDLFSSTSVNAFLGSPGDAANNTLYQDGSFTDTGVDLFTEGITPTGSPLVVDVTAAILADYAADTPGSVVAAFRFQAGFDQIIGGGTSQERVAFGFEQNLPVPTLTLTFIPEPASLALVGLGGLAMLRRSRG